MNNRSSLLCCRQDAHRKTRGCTTCSKPLCFPSVFVFIFADAVTAILRKLKQQSRESVEDKRPKLLKALREVSFAPASAVPVCGRHRRLDGSVPALISWPPGYTSMAEPLFFRIMTLHFYLGPLNCFNNRHFCFFSAARRLLSGAALGLSELG